MAYTQLISEAAAAAMRAEFPVLADAPEFAGSVTGAGVVYDPPRHACDVFDLPRPGARGGGSPRTADPFVAKLLVGECARVCSVCICRVCTHVFRSALLW